jgi:non-heme chloroperoxidase
MQIVTWSLPSFHDFYNPDLLLGKRVSEQAIQVSWNVAAGASAAASLGCVRAWQEDFREDRKRIDVPTLVIHGDADRIVPAEASGKRMPQFVKHAQLHIIKSAPHGCIWTHATEVNKALLEFVR